MKEKKRDKNTKTLLAFIGLFTHGQEMIEHALSNLALYKRGQTKERMISLNQKNTGAAIEKPLFVDQGCLEMGSKSNKTTTWNGKDHTTLFRIRLSKNLPVWHPQGPT